MSHRLEADRFPARFVSFSLRVRISGGGPLPFSFLQPVLDLVSEIERRFAKPEDAPDAALDALIIARDGDIDDERECRRRGWNSGVIGRSCRKLLWPRFKCV